MAKARILAVDDQLYFRVFLEDLLAQEGYEVLTAESGEAALGLLESEHVDVVLTDLVMPEMSGVELVGRIREAWPDVEIIVVTSVGDVRTAVDAMRRGATDYLLKPVDRTLLARAIESVLQSRRLRVEHARLMAENLEYLGMLSVTERAMGLFATLALEPLAERIVEGLCLETRAEGGVLWLAPEQSATDRLEVVAARGLVRLEEEVPEIRLDALPPELAPLRAPTGAAFPVATEEGETSRPALGLPLRHDGRVLGFVRLTDKLAGARFDERDQRVAERFAEAASAAVANALRHRALERRSFRDPATKAYTRAYFEDVVRHEIQKAGRFGRAFSLLRVELSGLAECGSRASEIELASWLEAVALQVGRALRATDLLALEREDCFAVLLPETDAVGASVLKRRIREMLESEGELRPPGSETPCGLHLATASYPVDGTQLETLQRVLGERVAQERDSLFHRLGLEAMPFPQALEVLASHGQIQPPEILEPTFAFVAGEVERRAAERGLFCLAPGAGRLAAVVDGLARLDGPSAHTEVVLVSEARPEALAGAPLTFVSPQRARTARPFAIYFAEGPVYALVAGRESPPGTVRLFHTADRELVEHLAFQVQRDLGIPLGR